MLFHTIYIEESVRDHPRVREILSRFKDVDTVTCEHYSQVFNKSAQNFRLQKNNPSLILARKIKNYVLSAPEGYGIGSRDNFYFSHMLNCLYDCRYCFLQGMYQSANYVLFVNYEDYFSQISQAQEAINTPAHFFSGYDCDSLALDPVTGFSDAVLDYFQQQTDSLLELRTKSTQIRSLLDRNAMSNVVVAFSLSPENVARGLEHKAPSLTRRLDAAQRLAEKGWQIGLRFDPVIYHADWETVYTQFFDQVFARFDEKAIHSVSLGVFRLPQGFFKRAQKLYPMEALFASPMQNNNGMMVYHGDIEKAIMDKCKQAILNHLPQEKFFPCNYE